MDLVTQQTDRVPRTHVTPSTGTSNPADQGLTSPAHCPPALNPTGRSLGVGFYNMQKAEVTNLGILGTRQITYKEKAGSNAIGSGQLLYLKEIHKENPQGHVLGRQCPISA